MTGGFTSAPDSFLFSFCNPEEIPPFKAPLKDRYFKYALYRFLQCRPTLGGGRDFTIANDANLNNDSYSKFDHTDRAPENYHGKTPKKNLLTGNKNFSPSEVEVLFQP